MDEKLPVLVWIYGGRFSFSSTSAELQTANNLLKRRRVCQHRLSCRPARLLAHPELSAETTNQVSGNYGLLDQIAGLQWVQRTSPHSVVIPASDYFRQIRRRDSVSIYAHRRWRKVCFHGAVSQSGGSFGPSRPTIFPVKTCAV